MDAPFLFRPNHRTAFHSLKNNIFFQEEDDMMTEEDEEFINNMIDEPGKDSGCTAVVALIRDKELYVANAGKTI